MDAPDEIRSPSEPAAAPDRRAVEGLFERIARDGVVAGIAELLTFCHDDVEMRAYAVQAAGAAAGVEREDVLRGKEEVLGFFKRGIENGFSIQVRTRGFEVRDESVLAHGSIRVTRPDGSFAETSLSWVFHFTDGLVDQIDWQPRAGA